ncbi:MAG: iron-containing alcohol dehydrogenase [Pirellulales bacterium]|nr:iron-containing alcohol dehydrogenase [Pirellulales bacterium]
MDRKAMLLATIRRLVQPGEVCTGKGSLGRLAAWDCRRVWIAVDAAVRQKGLVDPIVAHLRKSEAETEVWTCPSGEPTLPQVLEAAAAAGRFQPDGIVAVGGGSVLDLAKLAWAWYERPELDGSGERPPVIPPLRQKARLAAVPTTAGTGAEASQAAVYSHPADHRKVPVVSTHWLPDLVILDPTLTIGLSPEITAATGMDAFAHAAEAFVSRLATPLVQSLAATAVRLLWKHLPVACREPENLASREALLCAAYLAGQAQSAAATGLAHALAHAGGKVLQASHAALVSCFLPPVMELNAQSCGPLYDRFAAEAGFTDAAAFFQAFSAWREPFPLPDRLAALCGRDVTEEEIEAIRQAAKADVCLRTNPARVDDAQIEALLKKCP